MSIIKKTTASDSCLACNLVLRGEEPKESCVFEEGDVKTINYFGLF